MDLLGIDANEVIFLVLALVAIVVVAAAVIAGLFWIVRRAVASGVRDAKDRPESR